MVIWATEKLQTMYAGVVLLAASPHVARSTSRQCIARPAHKHKEEKSFNWRFNWSYTDSLAMSSLLQAGDCTLQFRLLCLRDAQLPRYISRLPLITAYLERSCFQAFHFNTR